ncbi:MAG: NAD-dependent epimerase/dehydratase family protein [Gemmatimonadaceae bacterium]|nr:NAD-dependent epimerase/dehydratase family protein [Gemmatimonadaceae bacterium]
MQQGLEGHKVLVVGAGWLGGPAAEALAAQGAQVWTLRREPPLTPVDGVISLTGDIRDPSGDHAWRSALPSQLDAMVVCIAPSQHRGDNHQSTYPAALRSALALATQRECRSLIYTSSTGVYGRTDGGVSREDDTITLRDHRQQALREAEAALQHPDMATAVDRTILRVAGLYGPGRNPANRFRAGVPTGDADVWCNFSWRDDVISAIAHLLQSEATPGRCRVFNCADGVPMRASTIARALGAEQAAAASVGGANAPSGRSNQQILVDPLRALGWAPTMRTVFDGLRALGEQVTLR